jgi:wyosine [tRNA(Phe)-imidazoG37] synthetase (radical SAM superfamily)
MNRPLNEIIDQINSFKHLENVVLASSNGEPTLYPHLFDLIEYLISIKLNIIIYSNGSIHDEKWWKTLSYKLKDNGHVVFTVCGTTQDLHEKYRVGSNLNKLIKNIQAFQSDFKNDVVQYIRFKYNQHDDISIYTNMFSKFFEINTAQYNEYLYNDEKYDMFNMVDKVRKIYLQSLNLKNDTIICQSQQDEYTTIDINGNLYPCDLYKTFCKDEYKNYDDILKFKYSFCKECNLSTTKILKLINCDNAWI